MEELDAHRFELCSLIAGGRLVLDELPGGTPETGPLTLSACFGSTGGRGAVIELAIGPQPLVLWVDELRWCEWVSPLLPTREVTDIAPELAAVLAGWTIEPLNAYCERLALGSIRVQELRALWVDVGPDVMLRLVRGAQELVLRVIAAPPGFLHALLDSMEPVPVPASLARLSIPVCVGWARLRHDELGSLPAGGCLVLDAGADVHAGQAWLYQEHPLAMLQWVPGKGVGVVDILHRETSTWHEDTLVSVRPDAGNAPDMRSQAGGTSMELDIRVTVVAEVARIVLSIEELRDLRKGSVIPVDVPTGGGVTLTVNGATVGTGQLIRLGEKLAVKID